MLQRESKDCWIWLHLELYWLSMFFWNKPFLVYFTTKTCFFHLLGEGSRFYQSYLFLPPPHPRLPPPPNYQLQISVGTAGPQPRAPDLRRQCWTSRASCQITVNTAGLVHFHRQCVYIYIHMSKEFAWSGMVGITQSKVVVCIFYFEIL